MVEIFEDSGHGMEVKSLPSLLTVPEVAELLRTSCKAIHAMNGRGQLPGVVRVGRRVLVRVDELVDWLDRRHTPSPKE